MKKSVTGAGGATTTTRYFGSLVEGRNGVMVKYYYAGGILVAKREAKNGALFNYHADRLGSTKLITDAAGSTAAGNSYAYAAFGRTVAQSGPVANERGFTGQQEDSEVGLIYMGARYYDPMTGRFISPDTIVPDPANPQSLNRYAYALNNPISYVDPTGHVPVAVAVAIFSAVAEAAAFVVATAPTWAPAMAWMGAGLTAVGYFTHNPTLSTIGAVMLGFASGYYMPTGAGTGALIEMGGGILGASVSLAISPLSPLDPGLKQAIGWAYMAYGMYKGIQEWSNKKSIMEGKALEEKYKYMYADDGGIPDVQPSSASERLYDEMANDMCESVNQRGVVDYRGHVVQGKHIRDTMSSMSNDFPYSEIYVTGGDRYRDSLGNIRSSTNYEIIQNSAKNSGHIGSMAIDFKISNFTPSDNYLRQYFDYINTNYFDNHIHGELRARGLCYE